MFGRRASSDEAASETQPGATAVESPLGKGRATPKRKEAEALRKKRLTPPRSRKEAAAARRERVKEQRGKQRAALATGDERYLPVRDQGPVKKYVRDYVDSHRTVGEFLIPVFLVMFVIALVLSNYTAVVGQFAWLAVLIALGLDSIRITYAVRKGITERFGAAETKGVTMYTLMRAWQMRRLRLPKAQVRPGTPI